ALLSRPPPQLFRTDVIPDPSEHTLWSPHPPPQDLLLATHLRCNLLASQPQLRWVLESDERLGEPVGTAESNVEGRTVACSVSHAMHRLSAFFLPTPHGRGHGFRYRAISHSASGYAVPAAGSISRGSYKNGPSATRLRNVFSISPGMPTVRMLCLHS